jgi:hypothetical protein
MSISMCYEVSSSSVLHSALKVRPVNQSSDGPVKVPIDQCTTVQITFEVLYTPNSLAKISVMSLPGAKPKFIMNCGSKSTRSP